MNKKHVSFNVLITGTGGQGVVLLTRILGEAALIEDFSVRIGEIHGVSQRGGSIVSHIKFGNELYCSTFTYASAQAVLSLEVAETLNGLDYLAPNGLLLFNEKAFIPASSKASKNKYPDELTVRELAQTRTKYIYSIDANKVAKENGFPKSANIVMLGLLAETNKLPMRKEALVNAMKSILTERLVDINLQAFAVGTQLLKKAGRIDQ